MELRKIDSARAVNIDESELFLQTDEAFGSSRYNSFLEPLDLDPALSADGLSVVSLREFLFSDLVACMLLVDLIVLATETMPC